METPKDLKDTLPCLPPLTPKCGSTCHCSSDLASENRREATAEIRRQWKQQTQKTKIVLRPKPPSRTNISLPILHLDESSNYHSNRYQQQNISRHILQTTADDSSILNVLNRHVVKKRPNYVLRIKLPSSEESREKWRPALNPKTSTTARHNKATLARDSKYFFMNPDWNSEAHTLETFRKSGQIDVLKQSWM